MKVFYSVFTIESGSLNYQGIAYGGVNLCEFLQSKGYGAHPGHVKEIVAGERFTDQLVVIQDMKQDSLLLTEDLLKDLKLEGIKAAKAVLRQRKQKKL